jgi:hypothetical protein
MGHIRFTGEDVNRKPTEDYDSLPVILTLGFS